MKETTLQKSDPGVEDVRELERKIRESGKTEEVATKLVDRIKALRYDTIKTFFALFHKLADLPETQHYFGQQVATAVPWIGLRVAEELLKKNGNEELIAAYVENALEKLDKPSCHPDDLGRLCRFAFFLKKKEAFQIGQTLAASVDNNKGRAFSAFVCLTHNLVQDGYHKEANALWESLLTKFPKDSGFKECHTRFVSGKTLRSRYNSSNRKNKRAKQNRKEPTRALRTSRRRFIREGN